MDSILLNTRWHIIQALAGKQQSATEIAKATRSSLPSITQQLKLLEAHGLVEYAKDAHGKIGKPRQVYRIPKPMLQLTLARQGLAEKIFLHPTEHQLLVAATLLLPANDQPFLLKAFLCNEELLEKCAIAYLRGQEEIEVLLLTEHVDEVRKKYSHITAECHGRTRKIVAWTHDIHELNDGIAKKDPYFENLLRKPFILHDPKQQFAKVQR